MSSWIYNYIIIGLVNDNQPADSFHVLTAEQMKTYFIDGYLSKEHKTNCFHVSFGSRNLSSGCTIVNALPEIENFVRSRDVQISNISA